MVHINAAKYYIYQVLPLHLATLDRGVPRPWDPGVLRPWDLGAVLLCPEVVLHPPLDQAELYNYCKLLFASY